MGKKSKDKGSAFERTVRTMFCKAWDIEMERSPRSGGWGKMGTRGDLIVDPLKYPYWPFFIECKNQQAWDITHLFQGTEKSKVVEWWEKAKRQAAEDDKTPLLVFTKKYSPIFVRCNFWLLESCASTLWFPYLYLAEDDSAVVLFEEFLGFWKPEIAIELKLLQPTQFRGMEKDAKKV